MVCMKKWKIYALFLAVVEGVGALAGWLTRRGVQAMASVPKSALTPPDAVFPVVWAILFALLGVGAAKVYLAPASPERTKALRLFWAQLAVNFLWSPIYFNWQAFALAFFWLVLLWVLILLMIRAFSKVDSGAAWLQLPYLLWVSFAGYLTLTTWLMNR
jgi:benzodiazapine receptor